LGGAQEIFDSVSEDFLGGTGKAEDAKLQGAGIIPKRCPMERVGTGIWTETILIGDIENGRHKRKGEISAR
jgi:hypothetical protein